MDTAARHRVVGELLALADSPDFRDRRDAGAALTPFAELPSAAAALRGLVLDTHDAAVTYETTLALCRRADPAAWLILCAAGGVAEPDHWRWIETAVTEQLRTIEADRDQARELCRRLLLDGDEAVRVGAGEFVEVLDEVVPILRSTHRRE